MHQPEENTKPIDLPPGFLDGPAPNLTKRQLDWKPGNYEKSDTMWAVVLDGVLSEEECDILVKAAERSAESGWERAMINIGGGLQRLAEETRKCGRIIIDSPELAAKIWARVENSVPEILRLQDWPAVTGYGHGWKKEPTWKLKRLNERMRFLKYTGGEYFKTHCDGTYVSPETMEYSWFTLHLYLTGTKGRDGHEDLQGGATTFHSYDSFENYDGARHMDVDPKEGRVLIFQQRNNPHSGDDVVNGMKITMRTDIMYEKENLE